MVNVCPYCKKRVLKDDDDRMVLRDSGIVCHGTCRKQALDSIVRNIHLCLMVGLLLLFGRNIYAQEGERKAPPPITINVVPKIAIVNPYKRANYLVYWRIERDERNRTYTYLVDCGGDLVKSTRDVTAASYSKMQSVLVLANCLFLVCVRRSDNKELCADEKLLTPDQPP